MKLWTLIIVEMPVIKLVVTIIKIVCFTQMGYDNVLYTTSLEMFVVLGPITGASLVAAIAATILYTVGALQHVTHLSCVKSFTYLTYKLGKPAAFSLFQDTN